MGNLLRGVVVLSLSSSAAWAQSPEVEMQLHGTRIDATVIGAPMPRLDKISVTDGKHHEVGALSATSYVDGDEPASIMFVMAGQEIWTGNDTFETDENAAYVGALLSIERGIDGLDLVHRFPRGSQAGIVTYATGATVRMPLSPLAQLHGSSFGTQRDYRNQIGTDLVTGVTLGINELERATTPRKLLIVIGDGNDTNNEVAVVQLAELKKRAAVDNIRVLSIVYKCAISDEANVVTRLTGTTKVVSSIAGIATEIDAFMHTATNRFYVSFDIRSLPLFDGYDHDLFLRLDRTEADPVTLWFPATPVSHSWWRGAWLQLVAGLAGVGLLALLSRRFAR